VAQRGRPVLLVASTPFEGFPSFAAVSGRQVSLYPVCPLEGALALFHLIPARTSSLFGRCPSPDHLVVARFLPKVPPLAAMLSGFRQLPQPRGLDPRSSPLQAGAFQPFACPILPWAWVPSAVPGRKGHRCCLARGLRASASGVAGAPFGVGFRFVSRDLPSSRSWLRRGR